LYFDDISVGPEMVDFGFPIKRIGIFNTARLERLCNRRNSFAILRLARLWRDCKKVKTLPWAKRCRFWTDNRTCLKIKMGVPGKAQNGEKAEHTRSM
jgi:hypothetical protein